MSLNDIIFEALKKYNGYNNISHSGKLQIGKFSGMKDMGGRKPYQYRADVPVTFGNSPQEHTLVIIGFGPNQGTGDNSSYSELVDSRGNPISSQQTPRNKNGLKYEVILPLVDLNRENGDELGRTSLDYITLAATTDSPLLQKANNGIVGRVIINPNFGNLTVDPLNGFDEEYQPFHYFHTLCYDRAGERIGDPHALYNPKPCNQVAGFISFKEEK